MKTLLTLFTAGLLAATASAAEKPSWETDFEAAKARAAKEGKPMLLDFTGSDWCGWCIKLKKEVFSQEGFAQYADEELVLVELDFPRSKEQSAAVKEQNEKLAKTYGIRGFPTILLLDSKGELVGRTGYRKGGPDAYVSHLKDLLAKAKTSG